MMQNNNNIINYSISSNNDIYLEKEINNKTKINSLKIEFQEPKEEIMHLLSPNKSNKKILEDDIYKTEMNNKKPIEIFQDITIDNQENKEDNNNNDNDNDLQYLIDKNKTEKIDFISTLLKLKGIKIEEDKNSETNSQINNITNTNTNSILGGQSNISTNISKINSDNKLFNNSDSMNEQNNNISHFYMNDKIDEIMNKSLNNIVNKSNSKTLCVNKNDNNNINNSKKLLRFCSSMIKNRKKTKIYNSSKSSKKRMHKNNNNINIKEKKNNHYLNIFNKVAINNNININEIKTKNKINYLKNLNDKKNNLLYAYKTDLSKKIPINNKNNIILYQNYNSKQNNSSSFKYKISCEETLSIFNKSYNKNNSALYKNRSKSIIQIDRKTKNKNLLNNSNNNKKDKKGKPKSYSQTKDIPKNIIKKNNINPFNNIKRKLINLKQKNLFIKEKFFNKEKNKNEHQGLFSNKSNMIFGNDNENSDTFRLNIKELKYIINKRKNDSKLIKDSKKLINYNNINLCEEIINKDTINSNEVDKNLNNNINLNIYNYKERNKDYINNNIFENINYLNENINNIDLINIEKKNIVLNIEINKRCFSKNYINNS